jgi:hypothetical protein
MHWDNVHNRLAPDAGPEHFKTYNWSAPLETHWRRATCEEVDCEQMKYGFVTTVDFSTELGQKQLHYLTQEDKDRRYSMQRTGPFEVKLIYGPGNPCMKRAEHRVPIGRPPLFVVTGGDWRGNPLGTRPLKHKSAEDWVDDFANHQQAIIDRIKRG